MAEKQLPPIKKHVPLTWRGGDVPLAHVDHALFVSLGDNVYLTFGQVTPPDVASDGSVSGPVEIRAVARFVMSPRVANNIAKLLSKQLEGVEE